MTGRSKIVLIAAILLAVCVITTTVFYIVTLSGRETADENMTMDGKGIIAAATVIVLALASIPFVYFTKVRRRNFEELLDKEYFSEYEIIKDAVMNSQLPPGTQKEIRNDVLDLLISAQKAGKKIGDAIGDTGFFIRDILKEYTSPGRWVLLSILDGFLFASLMALALTFLNWLEESGKTFYETTMDINMLVFILLVSFVIIALIRRLASSRNAWSYALPLIVGVGFVIISELLRRFLYEYDIMRAYLDGTVTIIPNVHALIIIVLLIITAFISRYFIRRWTIRKR